MREPELFPETSGVKKRGSALAERDNGARFGDRQHLTIPPQIEGPGLQGFGSQSVSCPLDVIAREQRSAGFGEMLDLGWIVAFPGSGTFEMSQKRARDFSVLRVNPPSPAGAGAACRKIDHTVMSSCSLFFTISSTFFT